MDEKRLKEIAEFLMDCLAGYIGTDGLIEELKKIGITSAELRRFGYELEE